MTQNELIVRIATLLVIGWVTSILFLNIFKDPTAARIEAITYSGCSYDQRAELIKIALESSRTNIVSN